jgi:hypothetical protein
MLLGQTYHNCCIDVLKLDAAEYAASKHKSRRNSRCKPRGKFSEELPDLIEDELELIEDGLLLLVEPAIIVDCKGRIILWYLPGLLLPPRQASMLYVDT